MSREKLDNNTEAMLPLMDEESSSHTDSEGLINIPSRSTRPRPWAMVLWLALVITGIVFFISGSLVILQFLSASRKNQPFSTFGITTETQPVEFSKGVRPPILGPEFPKKTVTFIKDKRFMGVPEEVHEVWAPYLDEHRFAAVGFDWDSGRGYGISGYHQLHCVWMYLRSLHMAIEGIKPDREFVVHSQHCVEYLRQSVICTADNTIERTYKGVFGTFEANNTHVCHDWDLLMDWAHENVYIPED